MSTRILCMTSDKYIEAVRPFLWLLEKYWVPTPHVVVAGFTPPSFELPDWARFISLGDFDRFPVNRWSDSLRLALLKASDEHIIIMLEDYWLVRPVNVEAVAAAEGYMQTHPSTIKFDLCADRLYAEGANIFYGSYGVLDLVWSKPGSPYHLSLMTGIWNTQHLLAVLQPEWSPWDVEIEGTRVLSRQIDKYVIGSHQWPVKHTLAFRSGDSNTLYLNELQENDVTEMRELGLLNPWEGVECLEAIGK